MSRVIAISGAAGSGKSTLVHGLALAIPDSEVLHFDDYRVEMPADLVGWLDEGADFNRWIIEDLAGDLATAREKGRTVVFEAPLGRRHHETGAHIDFLVYIKIPLEIALARLVRRELAGESTVLREYIDAYESVARDVYREQRRQVMPEADLVVDGRQAPEASVSQIIEAVRKL